MGSTGKQPTYREAMDAHAREYLTRVLKATGGERLRAAEMAGLNRTHLQSLIRRHGIDIPKNPRATARCKCKRCSNKTDSKGGKFIDIGFVCANCITPEDLNAHEEQAAETVTPEAENEPVRF